jgi:hypothetical protein
MTPEQRDISDWARQERQADLDWIWENLAVFWAAAIAAFEDAGRGAIVVDTKDQSDASQAQQSHQCLVGFLVIDRPKPADPAWLRDVEAIQGVG